MGEDALIYGEIYLLQTLSSGEDNFDCKDSIGFEVYKKFSGEYGDWGEGDLQFRMQYSPLDSDINITTPVPKNYYSIGNPVFHNAYINFKNNFGRNNIKVGHFDVPFGLEPELDTHGTILQTLSLPNFAMKKDWGISMNGQLDDVDYEVALTTGSGTDLILGRDNYLLSGRFANPTFNDFRWGISGAYGTTLRQGNSADLWRVGFDTQYYYLRWTFKAEVFGGETNDNPAYGFLGEIDYTLPNDNTELEFQFQRSSNNTDMINQDLTAIKVGISHELSENWSLRTVYSHFFNIPSVGSRDTVGIQFYYYGKLDSD